PHPLAHARRPAVGESPRPRARADLAAGRGRRTGVAAPAASGGAGGIRPRTRGPAQGRGRPLPGPVSGVHRSLPARAQREQSVRAARSRRPQGLALRWGLALSTLLGLASVARAQTVTLSPMGDYVVGPSAQGFMETTRPQPAPPELDAESLAKLQQARSLVRQGAYDAARALLEDAMRRSPHHPSLVSELVQLGYADHDWARLERLCRAERLAMRDSLFLSRPLLQSLTYQGRYRDAAQVAVEAVVAAPRASAWVTGELRNLAIADPAGVKMARDALRVAWTRNPQRDALLLLLAELEWVDGQTEHALTLVETPAKMKGGTTTLLWQFAQQRLTQGSWPDSMGAARA